MTYFKHKLLGAAVVLTASQLCAAGPMGFADSTMVMGDYSRNWQETFGNYALTRSDAVGAGVTRMRSDDKTLTRTTAELQYTKLLKRWNMKNAQANVWLFAGVGGIQGNDFSGGKLLVTPGIQLDYETQRVYLAATGRLYRAKGINHDYSAVRAGFSFYETEYDETQPWLVVEARRTRGLSDSVEITPMLRLINKNYFIELGASIKEPKRNPRINFMYIF